MAAKMLKRMVTDVVAKCTFAMIVANNFRPVFASMELTRDAAIWLTNGQCWICLPNTNARGGPYAVD